MKPSSAVRISERSHGILRELANERGMSMQAVLDDILESYRRQRFLDECDAAYEALRQDRREWAQYEAELRSFDATLMDGLEPPSAPDRDPAGA